MVYFFNPHAYMNLICKLFGHRWLKKSYENAMDIHGVKIPFTEKRVCSRCGRKEYKYNKWVDESLIPEGHRKIESF
jgi:hypothetical protein